MSQQVVEYNITDAAIAKMENLYMGLTITDIKNDEEFTAVHDARMVVKNHRVSIEKRRKELKSEALAWGKKVDGEANRIKGLLEPIESHLAEEEKKVTDELERIKVEQEAVERKQIQERVDTLISYNVVLPFFDVAAMPDQEYQEKLFIAKVEFERLEREKQAQAEMQAEKERKLAAERVEIERIRAEQEKQAQAQAEKEKVLRESLAKLESEKQAEAERKERMVWEKQAAEKAKIQAEKTAQERVEREAREKKEREEAEVAEKKRIRQLAPDKEKVLDFTGVLFDSFVDTIDKFMPELPYTSPLRGPLDECIGKIKQEIKNLIKRVEGLL